MTRSSASLSDLSALSGVAPALASAFASLTGDIALVIDAQGVIRQVAVNGAAGRHPADDWLGRSWVETVTGDTRRKIELLLKETGGPGVTLRREVNHPCRGGLDIPMSYAAVRLGVDGPVIALGRDLRAVVAIQQRFVDAQKEMERDYWKLRQEASRQRMLAHVATDAVMVVDGQTLAVLDINAESEALFGPGGSSMPSTIAELLATVGRTGQSAEVRTRLSTTTGMAQVDLCATAFRVAADESTASATQRILVRARRVAADGTGRDGEAVVVTDSSGRVLLTNAAFRALCPIESDGDVAEGRAIGELLGDPHRHLAALLADVRREALVRRPGLRLGGGRLPAFECFVQATLMDDGDQECIGLTLVPALRASADKLPGPLLALLEQAGDMPLLELLRRTSELTERHAVETALRRSADDHRGTAVMLGLSDDDLSERLCRLGLAR